MIEVGIQKKKTLNCYTVSSIARAIPILELASQIKQYETYQVIIYCHEEFLPSIQQLYPCLKMNGVSGILTTVQLPNNNSIANWSQHLDKMQDKPDLILVDYQIHEIIQYCNIKKIQFVINYPNSLQCLKRNNNMPQFRQSGSIGAVTMYHPNIFAQITNIFKTDNVLKNHQNGLILINSWFGLDFTTILPPNYLMTGPLIKISTEARLQQNFIDWIKTKKQKGKENFIYVNLKNYKCQPQFLKKLLEGLSLTYNPIIWNSNQPIVTERNIQNFWFGNFSESQILQIPDIKIVVIGGEWNQINQAIFHGKIMAVFCLSPANQQNIQLIQRRKIGLKVNIPNGIFRTIRKLLSDPVYLTQIQKISKAGRIQYQSKLGKCYIKRSLEMGNCYLIDKSYNQVATKTTLSSMKVLLMVGIGILILSKSEWFQKKWKLWFQ